MSHVHLSSRSRVFTPLGCADRCQSAREVGRACHSEKSPRWLLVWPAASDQSETSRDRWDRDPAGPVPSLSASRPGDHFISACDRAGCGRPGRPHGGGCGDHHHGRSRPWGGVAQRGLRTSGAPQRTAAGRTKLHRRARAAGASQCELRGAHAGRWRVGADLAVGRDCGWPCRLGRAAPRWLLGDRVDRRPARRRFRRSPRLLRTRSGDAGDPALHRVQSRTRASSCRPRAQPPG